MKTIINKMVNINLSELPADLCYDTPEFCYGSEFALWLQVPGIFLYKKPKKWVISLEYEDNAVNICGTSEVGCLNADGNLNEMLEALRKVVTVDGFVFRQPYG